MKQPKMTSTTEPWPISSLIGPSRKWKFTDEENKYLTLLSRQMTFREMAVELGMTVDEVDDFGSELFDRIFAERKRSIN